MFQKEDVVYKAYAELEAAAEAFYEAVGKFQPVYNLKTVSLGDLCEHVHVELANVDLELDGVM